MQVLSLNFKFTLWWNGFGTNFSLGGPYVVSEVLNNAQCLKRTKQNIRELLIKHFSVLIGHH